MIWLVALVAFAALFVGIAAYTAATRRQRYEQRRRP